MLRFHQPYLLSIVTILSFSTCVFTPASLDLWEAIGWIILVNTTEEIIVDSWSLKELVVAARSLDSVLGLSCWPVAPTYLSGIGPAWKDAGFRVQFQLIKKPHGTEHVHCFGVTLKNKG